MGEGCRKRDMGRMGEMGYSMGFIRGIKIDREREREEERKGDRDMSIWGKVRINV